MREPTAEQYQAFLKDCTPFNFDECGANVTKSFKYMHKKHPLAYFYFLKIYWFSWLDSHPDDIQTFLKWHGDVPLYFFEKFILPTKYREKITYHRIKGIPHIVKCFDFEF